MVAIEISLAAMTERTHRAAIAVVETTRVSLGVDVVALSLDCRELHSLFQKIQSPYGLVPFVSI